MTPSTHPKPVHRTVGNADKLCVPPYRPEYGLPSHVGKDAVSSSYSGAVIASHVQGNGHGCEQRHVLQSVGLHHA